MNFNTWFKNFLAEKNLPFVEWEIEADDGMMHFISNEIVIEHIKSASRAEKTQIRSIITKIDFHNGDINHFLNHLAKGIVSQYTK